MKALVSNTSLYDSEIHLRAGENRLPIPLLALLADAGGLDSLMPSVASETSSPVKPEPGKPVDAKDFGNAVWILDVRGTINECELIFFTGEGFSLVRDTDVKSYFLRYIDQPITFAEPAIHEVVLPPGEAEKIQQIFLRLEEENESELESWSVFDELEQAIKSFGIQAIELLAKLIETTSSYANAFIALDILGAMDHGPTYEARVSLALNTLEHNHPSVRHGAINALGSLKSEDSVVPLQSLIETDYSSLNRKVALRVLKLIRSTS